KIKTLALRGLASVAIFVAAMVLPLVLWLLYLLLTVFALDNRTQNIPYFGPQPIWLVYVTLFFPLLLLAVYLNPNGYSLHRLYRDRLSKAFLFDENRRVGSDLLPLDRIKLSQLSDDGPYHIINTALNVQGS